MTNIKIIIFLIATMALVTIAKNDDQKLVQKAFELYKAALHDENGEEAIKYLDKTTLDYYTTILELSKNADSLTVEKQTILDKLMIFSVRHRVPKEELLKFDGRSFLVYSIKTGMIGKSSIANASIGKVQVKKGITAEGQFLVYGEKTPFKFLFNKEDGVWKIDITSLFPVSNKQFQKMADESGKGLNEYLFSLLEMLTNKKPDNGIWEKVR